jgi:hypothetical protein
MILIWIRTRIRNNRATDPDPGGQLITDPLDLTWPFVVTDETVVKLVVNVNKSLNTVKFFFLNFFKSLINSNDPDLDPDPDS